MKMRLTQRHEEKTNRDKNQWDKEIGAGELELKD